MLLQMLLICAADSWQPAAGMRRNCWCWYLVVASASCSRALGHRRLFLLSLHANCTDRVLDPDVKLSPTLHQYNASVFWNQTDLVGLWGAAAAGGRAEPTNDDVFFLAAILNLIRNVFSINTTFWLLQTLGGVVFRDGSVFFSVSWIRKCLLKYLI